MVIDEVGGKGGGGRKGWKEDDREEVEEQMKEGESQERVEGGRG